MSLLTHTLDLYSSLPETVKDIEEKELPSYDYEKKAVAEWKVEIEKTRYVTYYWNNVSVNRPYQLLNDSRGNPIWVITVDYTFSDVAWRYKPGGEVITDFCGRRGSISSDFRCRSAYIFQLVPALRLRDGTNVCFVNNGCYNPVRARDSRSGRLMVIPNDSKYSDNSGSFDVKATIIEPAP